MEYAGEKTALFWSKGDMEVPLDFGNSCDQPSILSKELSLH